MVMGKPGCHSLHLYVFFLVSSSLRLCSFKRLVLSSCGKRARPSLRTTSWSLTTHL
uniref:Uncharacterized protein n=1 Tax=Anguilla anguilla TaxID=7936 RepID=A0A0E9WD51_ANGAN